MADYVDYVGKQFGTLLVKRLANVTDVCRRQDKSRKITEWVKFNDHRGQGQECLFIGRHKYWYCACVVCNAIHISRSDHLPEKICRCQKNKA